MRKAEVKRTTKETSIELALCLDGSARTEVKTGCGFLDHMLTLLSVHGRFDLMIRAKGDQRVDDHHLVEDTGLCLGQAFQEALETTEGINRYGTALVPMDESLARIVLDFSGRPLTVFYAEFSREKVGTFDTELVEEFFRAFSATGKATLHAEVLYGKNTHHQIEALFKALGRALREAVDQSGHYDGVPSSKGVIRGEMT